MPEPEIFPVKVIFKSGATEYILYSSFQEALKCVAMFAGALRKTGADRGHCHVANISLLHEDGMVDVPVSVVDYRDVDMVTIPPGFLKKMMKKDKPLSGEEWKGN